MSHSSRDQASRSHQSPELRQGPAFQSTVPCTSFFLQPTRTSSPFSQVTVARNGGRNKRRAATADFSSAEAFLRLVSGAVPGAKRPQRETSARGGGRKSLG